MHGLAALVMLLAVPPKTDAILKLESTVRAGYALIQAENPHPGDKIWTVKQIEWVVTTDSQEEITYDATSDTSLVVTLPREGIVTVHAVALMANGVLAPAVRLDLPAGRKSAGVPPLGDAAGGLRITVVVDSAWGPNDSLLLKPKEEALLNSKLLHDRLGKLGHKYLFSTFNNPSFQAAWERTPEDVKRQLQAPFLFVQNAQHQFVAAYPLHLSDELAANEKAILALFPER